jgi:iron complex outermembrane receptor protein
VKQRLPRSVFLVGAALGAATSSGLASAETAPGLSEIIVTGTRIKDRTVLDSPVAVDVLTAEELRQTGALAGELGQALQSLAPSFNFPRQSNSGGADHVRAAQLRGMSPDQVLVLVNGKRRHTSALVNLESKTGKGTTPVDFNAIPLNSIKRIEVLRDGAGAQYGSDAIAGVINIILEDAPEGGEASVSYGQNYTSFKPTDQRLSDGETWVAQVKDGFAIGDGGFLRAGAEYRDHGSTNRSGFDTVPDWIADPTPANLATRGQRNYRPGDGDARDVALWFNSRLPLGGFDFYSFGTYNDRDSVGAAFFRYPDSSQNVPEIYPFGFRPDSLGTNTDLSLTGGFSGEAAAWAWDTSLTYGSNEFDYRLRNSLNASLGPTSPTKFRLGKYQFDQFTLNLDANRDFAVGASGRSVNVAVGSEYRHEQFQTKAGDPASYAAGPFTDLAAGAQAGPGLTPADQADTSRDVVSVYGDASTHLTDAFLVELAGRYENYSDFGDAFAGKLSGIYQVVPSFAIRGAVSNSFRAPSLSQVSYKATGTNFGDGGVLRRILTLPVADPIARALGAKDLKAEKSVNFSLGVTYAPVDNFNITVDAYEIKVKDRITVSERIGGSDLTDFIETNFGVSGVDSVNFFTNAVDTKTQGVDVVATWSQAFDESTLQITGAFSYAKTSIDSVQPTPPELIALGFDDVLFGVEERNTLTDANPHSKGILTATWTAPRWSALGRLTRYDSAVRVFNFGGGYEPRQEYGAKFQLDLEGEYKILDNLSVALGANNVLDEYPDLSSDEINYAGNFPYDVISPIGFNGAYYYARATYSF